MDDRGRLSFGGVADRYERGRPTYPDDAASWLLGGDHRGDQEQDHLQRVVELGAGTGKLTEVLRRHGAEVLATDPDERMLHHLRSRLPEVPAVVGVAEQIPLPSRSVDVLVAAQAFHWFDLPRAVPEIARVLRPAGVLALVWNVRDEQVPWVRKLGRMIGGPVQESDPTVSLADYEQVVDIEEQTFRHWQSLDRQALLDMVASRSNVATLDDDEREQRLAAVTGLYDDYGRGADGLQLPYVTRCYRISLRDLAPRTEQTSIPAASPPPQGEPVEEGEPTIAMDRADLPFSPRPRREGPGGLDDGTTLVDLS